MPVYTVSIEERVDLSYSQLPADGASAPVQVQEQMDIEIASPASLASECDISQVANTVEVETRCAQVERVETSTHYLHHTDSGSQSGGKHPKWTDTSTRLESHYAAQDRDQEEAGMLEKLLNQDDEKIPVKLLRGVIPKMRMSCYFTQGQIAGKRKMKHLWENRPSDWPPSVPFVDPNNGDKKETGGKGITKPKPGKTELLRMFRFLKQKYSKEVRQVQAHPAEDGASPLPSPLSEAPATPPSPQEQQQLTGDETDQMLGDIHQRLHDKAINMGLLIQQQHDVLVKLNQVYYDVILVLKEALNNRKDLLFDYLNACHQLEAIIDKTLLGSKFGQRLQKKELMDAFNELIEGYSCILALKTEPEPTPQPASHTRVTPPKEFIVNTALVEVQPDVKPYLPLLDDLMKKTVKNGGQRDKLEEKTSMMVHDEAASPPAVDWRALGILPQGLTSSYPVPSMSNLNIVEYPGDQGHTQFEGKAKLGMFTMEERPDRSDHGQLTDKLQMYMDEENLGTLQTPCNPMWASQPKAEPGLYYCDPMLWQTKTEPGVDSSEDTAGQEAVQSTSLARRMTTAQLGVIDVESGQVDTSQDDQSMQIDEESVMNDVLDLEGVYQTMDPVTLIRRASQNGEIQGRQFESQVLKLPCTKTEPLSPQANGTYPAFHAEARLSGWQPQQDCPEEYADPIPLTVEEIEAWSNDKWM